MTTDFLPPRTTDRTAPVNAPVAGMLPAAGGRPKTIKAPEAGRPRPYRRSRELPRSGANPERAPENHMLELDGWGRKMSAALAHMKQAYRMIDLAEATILQQRARIALLEDLSTTDDLTGLKNRRGFIEHFDRELEHCNRGLSKGGLLVMIDLDNFKTANDTYGHLAGDCVLKLVGRTLVGEIRKTDVAARPGGDEFVLLLANATDKDAAARAQVIAAHLNNLSLAWSGDIIPVRASVGLKSYHAGDRLESVLHAADSTLYASKSGRKNNPDNPLRGIQQETPLKS